MGLSQQKVLLLVLDAHLCGGSFQEPERGQVLNADEHYGQIPWSQLDWYGKIQ